MVIMWSIRKRKISLALSFKANMKPGTNLGRFPLSFDVIDNNLISTTTLDMYVQHLYYQRENVMQFRGNSSDQAAAFGINLLASQGAQKKNYHNFKKLFQKRGKRHDKC